MADARYQAEPRLPRTLAIFPVCRAPFSPAFDNAGHRVSTSRSETRISAGVTVVAVGVVVLMSTRRTGLTPARSGAPGRIWRGT
jgi:hypothetical protein